MANAPCNLLVAPVGRAATLNGAFVWKIHDVKIALAVRLQIIYKQNDFIERKFPVRGHQRDYSSKFRHHYSLGSRANGIFPSQGLFLSFAEDSLVPPLPQPLVLICL